MILNCSALKNARAQAWEGNTGISLHGGDFGVGGLYETHAPEQPLL